ncbi:ribosomal protein S8A [Massospora cicadina]|nr:ribosomal protein S8A [Massospora cicadina]
MGISRDTRHKRSATGAKRAQYRKKRKFELGRQSANTKLGPKRIHIVRTRGGNTKFRAMRLETGTYSWGSESISRKARIVSVVYNASNNELVRTNTLVKSAIVQIDAAPFVNGMRHIMVFHLVEDEAEKKKSNHVQRKLAARKDKAAIDPHLEQQFNSGRLYAAISSRPGQSGRCDGYILEGKELDFYLRKLNAKK